MKTGIDKAMLLICLMSSACGSTGSGPSSKGLTKESAQRAVNIRMDQIKVEFAKGAVHDPPCSEFVVGNGSATLDGVQEFPQLNSASARLSFHDLAWQWGSTGTKADWNSTGIAEFTHYNDGRWVLTHLLTNVYHNCNVVLDLKPLNIEVK